MDKCFFPGVGFNSKLAAAHYSGPGSGCLGHPLPGPAILCGMGDQFLLVCDVGNDVGMNTE